MAQRPGGPLGDYVSQAEYATESIQERQAVQAEDQQAAKQQIAPPPDLAASSFSRPPELARAEESQKLTPDEKMAAYNESIKERNDAERAERRPQTEQADEKKDAYRELAQEVAAQQKQESPGLDQSRQQQPELGD